MAQLHRRLHRLPHPGLTLSAAALFAALGAFGAGAYAQSAPAAAAPDGRGVDEPPPAPAPRSTDDEEDTGAESSTELDALLARLRTDNAAVRRAAVDEILALEASAVPTIRTRLLAPLGMSHFAVHAAMVRAIRAATGGREGVETDLMEALVQFTPRTPDLDVATERVVLVRALGRIPSADAGRALVAFALAHNRIFRLESLRVVRTSMRDYVLPALIEIRRPSDDTRMFIRQAREAIRRVTPGESVQTRDNALLAEILRAYASLRQPDAMNVVISFINSDRVQVREAARWAVGQYGRESNYAIRQAYENFVGEYPPREWNWERVANEMYAAYDRRRAEEVVTALEEGLTAGREQRYADMMGRFEFVLTRHPLFDRRAEMVEPLMAYAHSLESSDATRAERIYRMALRVDPEGASARAIQGAILYLEAERALARGVADPELYRAALRADPNHARARAQFEAVAQVQVLRSRWRKRAMIALGLLAVALAGVGLLVLRARGQAPGAPTRTPPTPPRDDDEDDQGGAETTVA
jgi:hypothetical protein